jgi:hypothetical protein
MFVLEFQRRFARRGSDYHVVLRSRFLTQPTLQKSGIMLIKFGRVETTSDTYIAENLFRVLCAHPGV